MTTTLRFCNRPRRWGLLCGSLLVISLLVNLLPANVAQAAATTITFNDFADISALTLNGNAAQVGTVLRLAPAVGDQKGSAYLTAPQRINSFQSRFQFHFNSAVNNTSDGMTFVMQSAGVNALGGGGGSMGYEGMRQSVAVFFEPESGCGQKVGIAVNGSSVDGCVGGAPPPFNLYGSPVTVWVDYDATSTTLQVFLAQDTNKPSAPLLAQNVDMRAIVGPAAFVGFTAATGGAFMNHDLLNWSFALETLPPVAAPTQTPPANAAGWNNSNVTVNWNWEDAGPGIDAANCTMSSSAGAEGQSTLSATCSDLAGGQGSAGTEVKIDKTAPTISAAATTNPNGAGWYNHDITVHFTCADGVSGVAACPADQVLSSEGSAVASTAQTAGDLAGNTSDASNVVTVQLDKTAPVVAVTGVSSGGSYPLGSVPAAGCSTTDALSGVAAEAAVSITGGSPSGTGFYTATCSGAADVAGNSGSASVTYSVAFRWTGFLQPVDNLPTVNTANAGSSIPIKFSLGGDFGLSILAGGYPKVQAAACSNGGSSGGSDAIEETVAAGNSGLQYDAKSQTYSYVWKTDKAWAGSCRTLTVKLTDGTEHSALFQFGGKVRSAAAPEEEAAAGQLYLPAVNR